MVSTEPLGGFIREVSLVIKAFQSLRVPSHLSPLAHPVAKTV